MKKFTIIELLAVIAIMSILVTLLLPSLKKAHEEAKVSVCASNQSQIYISLVTYSQDNSSYMPWVKDYTGGQWTTRTGGGKVRSLGLLVEGNYLKNTEVFYCPGWTHPVVQYDTKVSSGKYGGWPAPGNSFPSKYTWTSYAYRHYPNTGHPDDGSPSLLKNSNTTAVLADHWTKRADNDFGWDQGSGRFTHYTGDRYVTTFLDGKVGLTHDKTQSLILASIKHTKIYNIEDGWRIFFDKK